MSLYYGVDPIGLPKINSENQSVKPRKSSNTKYYKVLYFILKVRDLFQNCMVKPLIVVNKRKTSKHIIFNHKYTFLFISAYKNITIYSHLKWFTKSTSSALTLMKRVNCTDLVWCASQNLTYTAWILNWIVKKFVSLWHQSKDVKFQTSLEDHLQ